jgi:YD repeat-containing protein
VKTRTYASAMVYLASGALAKEQLGTDTPIFNKLFYNVRGQLAEIRESTSYTGATDTSGDRGAIINHYSNQAGCRGASCNATDNNGNLRRQEVYIPRPDSTDWDNFAQFYEYDALNRLQSVRENENGGAVQWQQQYVYDRYGNRTIDYNHTSSDIPRPQFSVNPSNNRLGVPSGQTGVLSYDAAGNLTNDTYTGNGSRIYDAENRMIAATESISGQTSTYTYDGDGRRARRSVNGQESWQVYGMGGELLAEYDITYRNVAHHTVRQVNLSKEYGYRNGQLLITAAVPASVLCGTYDACGASPPEEIGPIGELESGAGGPIQWLVTDQLGTPRMIFDQSGSLAGVSRHDYLPFGEELFAGTGGRTVSQGYGAADGVRQKFTSKERDIETGLDYFGARYFFINARALHLTRYSRQGELTIHKLGTGSITFWETFRSSLIRLIFSNTLRAHQATTSNALTKHTMTSSPLRVSTRSALKNLTPLTRAQQSQY